MQSVPVDRSDPSARRLARGLLSLRDPDCVGATRIRAGRFSFGFWPLTFGLVVLLSCGSAFALDRLRRIDDTVLQGNLVSLDMKSGATMRVPVQGAATKNVTVPADEIMSIRLGGTSASTSSHDDRVVTASGERWFVTLTGSEGTRMKLGPGAVLKGSQSVPFADLRVWIPYRARAKNETDTPRAIRFTCAMHPQVVQDGPGKCPICGMVLVPVRASAGAAADDSTDAVKVERDPDLLEARLLSLKNDEDLLLMSNGDRMGGVVESVAPDQVALSGKLGKVSVPHDSVLAVAFSKTLKPWTAPRRVLAKVYLSDGSVVLGDVGGPKDGAFTLHSVLGPRWSAASKDVRRIVFSGGKLAWLSDLDPVDVKITPYLNRTWEYRRDASVWGKPLSVAGTTYERGLGVHARTQLTYDLDGAYHYFVAEVGVDDETNKTGSAAFSVLGDGKVLLAPLKCTGGDKPHPIRIDVTGVKKLTLLADFAGDDDFGDHADWLNARVVRK